MIGIQYSWYGAGFIDYMFRGSNGDFIMAHRMRNSNINTEAYMRTGNQPVRYEVINESAIGKLKSNIGVADASIELEDASDFPDDGGTIYIDNELVTYTGITGNTLTGCTREAPLQQFASGATRTYTAGPAATHSAKTGLVLVSNTTTPIIQHWGSSFITDGGFDSDRGFLFSYAATGVDLTTTKNTAFLIRLAPSVSNALTGDLGERELINRAQLLLEGLEITSETSTGGIVVQGILNPQNYPANPDDIGWGGLTNVAQGGQPSFAQIAPGGSVVWNSGDTATTASVALQGNLNTTFNTSGIYFNRSNRDYIYVKRSVSGGNSIDDAFENFADMTGKTISGSGIPNGSVITSYYLPSNSQYGYIRINGRTTVQYGTTETTLTVANGGGTFDKTNFLFFQQSSWESAGATIGTETDDANFPAGTSVSKVETQTWGGTEYYRVEFSQSSLNTITAPGTIQFVFRQPPYAQPGETIFSFIANPGERSTLDLTFIKELTNTTLGGRGTFPNGPDVLAINVFKTSGNDTTGNIILRWSEAQA